MTNPPRPGSAVAGVPSSIPKPTIPKPTISKPAIPKWKGRRTLGGSSSLRLNRQRSEPACRPQPAQTVFGRSTGGPGIGTENPLRFGSWQVKKPCLWVSRLASQIFGEKPLAAWGGS
jgi:hypothetical protein